MRKHFIYSGGGYCYGARFDEDFNVVHSSVNKLDDCKQFQGSKYVQSDMVKCFPEIKRNLMDGEKVLFTGTPCQVAAVRNYLNNSNINADNYYAVDIVCHGVPNVAVWKDYVEHLQKSENSKLVKFSFRYKPRGWKGYPIYAEFKNGKKYVNKIKVSSYQNLFRKNLLMRESCFDCPYPGNFKSDLTICDFWGVEQCVPAINTAGGVSLIIGHSDKGNELLSEMMKKRNITCFQLEGHDYLKYNNNLVHATSRPDEYDIFWKDYNLNGLQYVLKKYGGENIKGKFIYYTKDLMRRMGIAERVKKIIGQI